MTEKKIKKALTEVKKVLVQNLNNDIEIFLFGSVARKEYVPESDIDILVLVPGKTNRAIEEKIIEMVYEVELQYNVVFGVVVYSKKFWSSQKAKVMPFYKNIQNEAQRI